MLGQFCLMVSHQVASSLWTVGPAAVEEPEAAALLPADDAPLLAADEAALLAADDAALVAAAEEAALVAGALVVVALPELLLELHAVAISAIALIPAMVAIAFRAESRDTRVTSVSALKRCEGIHSPLMKALSASTGKSRSRKEP